MQIVKKQKLITKEDILALVSPYDIYRKYFGEFQVNKKYLNHLRGDKEQPSFEIRTKYSELTHVDYGCDFYRGNCINLVQQIYRCDFNTALRTIDEDFKLGLYNKSVIRELESVITWKQPKIVEEKKPSVIQCITQKFTKLQLDWWNSYDISEEDLKKSEANVEIHSIKSFYLNKDKMPVEDLIFGYLFEGKYWKIYKPLNKKSKWLTNCPIDVCYGLDNIKECNSSIVVKSVKDYKVCRKFLTSCCCGVQNESSVAISDENIEYIINNSLKSYTIFDNDEIGVKSSQFYNSKGFGYWNVNKRYLTQYKIKDPSDFVNRYGGERLRKEVSKKIKL